MGCVSVDVADRQQLLALALRMEGPAPASGPAQITETQPNNGAQTDMIASRCRRMQFRSNEARKRFLSVHAILAKGA